MPPKVLAVALVKSSIEKHVVMTAMALSSYVLPKLFLLENLLRVIDTEISGELLVLFISPGWNKCLKHYFLLAS